MKTGRPAAPIALSEADKAELLRRVNLRKGPQDACTRAKIILACSEGKSGNSIALRLGVSKDVVSRWRLRFSKWGLPGLNDEQRSGRPRMITSGTGQPRCSLRWMSPLGKSLGG